ncbi:helix-turn-helix domain-containing protein [Kocuria rhizophila]|uniref:helix-turn-helix domain-containing protein n=1 Tax=Kocuria rhizophila TaxID=72000 RepID=UPI0016426385
MANSPSGEPLIARFDRVLDAFGPAHPQLTFREVCAATRLPPSTAHRILGGHDPRRLAGVRARPHLPGGDAAVGARLPRGTR